MKYENALNSVLEDDGLLRDIIIPISNGSDYNKIIEYLATQEIKFFTEIDGKPATPNDCIKQFTLGEERSIGLTKIFISDIQINLWYYDECEIELDFFACDVNSESKWNALVNFIKQLARIYFTDIGIFTEGDRTLCWLKIRS